MKRTYMTAIPLQKEIKFEKGMYQPDDFSLSKNCEAFFPIIPIIASTMDDVEVEEIRVIVFRIANKTQKDHYETFLMELETLGLGEENIMEFPIPEIAFDENFAQAVPLWMEIPMDSFMYADVTFATPSVLLGVRDVMHFVECEIKRYCDEIGVNFEEENLVGGIFLGKLPIEDGKSNWENAKLYDITELIHHDVCDMLYITKRSGDHVVYNFSKLRNSLQKTNNKIPMEANRLSELEINRICFNVDILVDGTKSENSTEEIRHFIKRELMVLGKTEFAQEYLTYRHHHPKKFINCSNHHSNMWNKEQRNAAEQWGEIVDYPFPNISANADEQEICECAEQIVGEIMKMDVSAVMCQGEYTLTYAITTRLLESGIPVLVACSERKTEEIILEDGSVQKQSIFRFVKFRKYSFSV